jgi:hypothetical protein
MLPLLLRLFTVVGSSLPTFSSCSRMHLAHPSRRTRPHHFQNPPALLEQSTRSSCRSNAALHRRQVIAQACVPHPCASSPRPGCISNVLRLPWCVVRSARPAHGALANLRRYSSSSAVPSCQHCAFPIFAASGPVSCWTHAAVSPSQSVSQPASPLLTSPSIHPSVRPSVRLAVSRTSIHPSIRPSAAQGNGLPLSSQPPPPSFPATHSRSTTRQANLQVRFINRIPHGNVRQTCSHV